MIREELEFRIARYADDDLSASERSAVEAELASDAEARALLAEYQTLRTAIEEAAGPALPKVHWDRLEQLLSSAVAKSIDTPGGPEKRRSSGDVARDGALSLGFENEFALACHADGSLSLDRRAQVVQLIEADDRARAIFNEYHDLDAAIKAMAYSDPPPAVRWERLTEQISGIIDDAGVNAGLPEDVERQVAAFVAGELPAEECDAIDALLAATPSARVLASEYRDLDAVLRGTGPMAPVPAVDWERFAAQISATIDRQAVQAAVRSSRFNENGFSILKWLRSPGPLALAASVLVGIALIARLFHGGPGALTEPHVTPAPQVEEVAVLKAEAPTGAAQSEINIGPPAVASAPAGDDDYAVETGDDDNVVSRPPRAFVASGRATAIDTEVLPAMPF